jgi:hypothetical protein
LIMSLISLSFFIFLQKKSPPPCGNGDLFGLPVLD